MRFCSFPTVFVLAEGRMAQVWALEGERPEQDGCTDTAQSFLPMHATQPWKGVLCVPRGVCGPPRYHPLPPCPG